MSEHNPDGVAELVAELERVGATLERLNLLPEREVVTRAASALQRLVGERDSALARLNSSGGSVEAMAELVASADARAQAAESLAERRRVALDRIASFTRERPGAERGSYQRGYDIGFNNAGLVAAGIARQALCEECADAAIASAAETA